LLLLEDARLVLLAFVLLATTLFGMVDHKFDISSLKPPTTTLKPPTTTDLHWHLKDRMDAEFPGT